MKYRRKPVEAFRYHQDPSPPWFTEAVTGGTVVEEADHCLIQFPGGNTHRVNHGDWVIETKGGPVGIFAMSDAEFQSRFEEAPEAT